MLIPEVGSSNKTIEGLPSIAIKISNILRAPCGNRATSLSINSIMLNCSNKDIA